MANRRKSRRTISVRGSTYRRLRILAEKQGTSMSGLVEDAIAPFVEGIVDPGPSAISRPRVNLSDLEAIERAFGPRYT